ncbi:MAG: alpha/beta hydrolase [Bacteroidota bacterium]
MPEYSLNFNFSARYFTLGPESADRIKEVWFVLHGYGQLAEYFIRKFKPFDQSDRLIVAPEGLSRFYLNGFQGRVGATWMTKEDRLRDIENYITYLNAVEEEVFHSIDGSKVKINILGFSQGVATASRWIANYSGSFNKIVFWAGVIPPDLNFDLALEKLTSARMFVVYGNKDPFVTEESIKTQIEVLDRLKIPARKLLFDGDHDITSEGLSLLSRHLD